MENILLIRLKSIGDVVLTLPAVHRIRENFPDAKITFLTSKENAGLITGFREVDESIVLDRAALKNPRRAAPEFFRLLRQLRGGKFSRVMDFQGYGETAWLTRLTGAPHRWGCVDKESRRWAYTHARLRRGALHPAAEYLQLLSDGGLKNREVKNQFHLPPSALMAAGQFFAGEKIPAGTPVLFLQPFTSSAPKDWPLENFLALARHFRAQGVAVIFGGGPADRVRLAAVAPAGFPVSAGVPLLVTAGLMQLATLIIGGDTGALHLAVAQGRRVLMLMQNLHPGSPVPFQHPGWILPPARNGEIASIALDAVIAAAAPVLSAPAGNASC